MSAPSILNKEDFSLLLVTHSLGIGGSPISLYDLAIGLRDKGFKIIISSAENGELRERFINSGFHVKLLPRSGFLELKLIISYAKLIKKKSISAIHLNTLTSYFKYPAIAGFFLRVPVYWWVRENVNTKRSKKLFFWLKNIPKKVIPVSYAQSQDLQLILKKEVIQVLRKGIKHYNYSPDNNTYFSDLSKPIIGFIGTLEERKGVHDLVSALACAHNANVDFTALIFGADPTKHQSYKKKLEEKISLTKGLSKKIIFMGQYADVRPFYKQFNFFVFPTYWDCCARVLLEAMDAKCPIITTNVGGTPEMLKDEISALLVPPRSPVKLCEQIIRLINNPSTAASLAERAKAFFTSEFLLEKHITDTADVYYSELRNDL